MYSTVGLLKNSKRSGRLMGTHQKLDRVAFDFLKVIAGNNIEFPDLELILSFEGVRGPDGLKRKSPGKDEPMHFIQPEADDGKLIQMILDHQFNLKKALRQHNMERAAFEAAWMAHAITDGLTPAHHFPYQQAISELMSDKEYVKIFGQPIKGIMRGDSVPQTARNNWLYWGPEGYMTKHIAFEYGVAVVATAMKKKTMTPKFTKAEIKKLQKGYHDFNLKQEFYKSLEVVDHLKMYTRFRDMGWTTELAAETKAILLPEIVRCITVAWASCLPKEKDEK